MSKKKIVVRNPEPQWVSIPQSPGIWKWKVVSVELNDAEEIQRVMNQIEKWGYMHYSQIPTEEGTLLIFARKYLKSVLLRNQEK